MATKSPRSKSQKSEKSAKVTPIEAKKFAFDVKKQAITAWTAALGLVIALAWNSVFMSLFQSITGSLFKNAPAFLALIFSACFTTILAVIGIIILNKWSSKPPKMQKNNK